jgi:putative PIN family toxin of toxin-antitoxin system
MRVLLDTNVLVRATGTATGPARVVYLKLLQPPHEMVTSSVLLDELRRVLEYPRVQRLHALTSNEVEQYVRDFGASAILIDLPMLLPFPGQRDPDDDPVIAAAVFGRVDVLCTLDRHLRKREVVQYCDQFHIRVLTDVELLTELSALGPD